jgi:hypothetical protein
MNFPLFLKENLGHLRRVCGALGWTDKAALVEAELSSLPVLEAAQ